LGLLGVVKARQELPPDLRRLARLNALEMSCDHRYQFDADRLMDVIEKAIALWRSRAGGGGGAAGGDDGTVRKEDLCLRLVWRERLR
jgi:hypothetical protein